LERPALRATAVAGPLEDDDVVARDDVAELRAHLLEGVAVRFPVPPSALAAMVGCRIREAGQLRVFCEKGDHRFDVAVLLEAAQRRNGRISVRGGHAKLQAESARRPRAQGARDVPPLAPGDDVVSCGGGVSPGAADAAAGGPSCERSAAEARARAERNRRRARAVGLHRTVAEPTAPI